MAEEIRTSAMEWRIQVQGGLESHPVVMKCHNGVFKRISEAFERCKYCIVLLCKRFWQLGADDPRRVIHSIKVGLALSLVSLFYFMKPLSDGVGGNAIWAIMTVVVVFEFTVGATFSKGLNRSSATLLAGSLAVGVSYLAEFGGKHGEGIILSVSVFVLGAALTFSRFFPKIKKKYDYGVVVFLLTFNLIAISGYRVENLFQLAHQRLATILIGCALCFLISVLICPIWAGDDLHNLITRNLEALAGSLEGCVSEYFVKDSDSMSRDDEAIKGYKCVFNSKSTEESLANFASWEPAHGQFVFRYPWKHYLKVGAMMRYCAYCVEALNVCLNSEIQAPHSLRAYLKAPCMKIGTESANVLRELVEIITTMTRRSNSDVMMDRLTKAVENLQNSLRSQPELFIDSKRWQTAEEKYLKSSENLPCMQEGPSIESQRFILVSIVKPSEQPEETVNSQRTRTTRPAETHGDNIMPAGSDHHEDKKSRVEFNREIKRAKFPFVDTLPLATFASLLTEIVSRLESLIGAVDELAERANFKTLVSLEEKKLLPTRHPLSTSPQISPTPTVPPPSPPTSTLQPEAVIISVANTSEENDQRNQQG